MPAKLMEGIVHPDQVRVYLLSFPFLSPHSPLPLPRISLLFIIVFYGKIKIPLFAHKKKETNVPIFYENVRPDRRDEHLVQHEAAQHPSELQAQSKGENPTREPRSPRSDVSLDPCLLTRFHDQRPRNATRTRFRGTPPPSLPSFFFVCFFLTSERRFLCTFCT